MVPKERAYVDAAHVHFGRHQRRLPLERDPTEAKATLDVRMMPEEDPRLSSKP
jgi:hypothetical protein